MSDDPNTPTETPMERALRLKNAATAAKQNTSGRGKVRKQDAAMASGASKPAMRK